MYQLQALFGFLQESERQYYETRDLCHAYRCAMLFPTIFPAFSLTFCLRDYDGQPVNTSQQMDVDEYFNMLFDKLEKCLKNTPQERILQDCFGGKVVNQIICKEPVRLGDQVSTA
jgi:ubiquitin carboxyl-terminal hydrolase 34